MTFFAHNGPRPPEPPKDPKQSANWEAPAPCCGINARWSAVASNSGDYSRTRVEYVIETTCACPVEAKEIA